MKYTLQEWKEEAIRRFGNDYDNYAFVCPACGKVSTGKEFRKAGATPDDMYTNCIGRFTGQGSPSEAKGQGCNWAAYGLFGTLGKGDSVETPNGDTVEVFSFAEVSND